MVLVTRCIDIDLYPPRPRLPSLFTHEAAPHWHAREPAAEASPPVHEADDGRGAACTGRTTSPAIMIPALQEEGADASSNPNTPLRASLPPSQLGFHIKH